MKYAPFPDDDIHKPSYLLKRQLLYGVLSLKSSGAEGADLWIESA